jgi:hypothetical protein
LHFTARTAPKVKAIVRQEEYMKKGKLSTLFGVAQIVCVTLMFTIGKSIATLDMILVLLAAILIIAAVILSAVSFWKKEKPIAWAIAGLSISLFWSLWVLIAPMLRAF